MERERHSLDFLPILLVSIIVTSILGSLFFNMYLTSSCDYHEPISKEPSRFIATFFYLSNGHLEVNTKSNWILWVASGSIIGFIIYRVKVLFTY